MEDNHLNEVKKLIQDHKRIQERNLKLIDILNAKMLEIKLLRDNELKMQSQMKEVLVNTVNLENITGKYIEIKERYERILDEKKMLVDTYKNKELELVEKYEKELHTYRDKLAKEEEKFSLRENQYLTELKNTSQTLTNQMEEVDKKWKSCLENANQKLKESNLSCTALRTQLYQANYRQRNADLLQQKVRELESKLEEKEKELSLARQVLYVKENYKSPQSPTRDLYKANTKKGPFKFSKKPSTPNLCGDSPPLNLSQLTDFHKYNSNDFLRQSLPTVSESAPETTVRRDISLMSDHKMQSSCELTPVRGTPIKDKPKKRKLYDPISAHMEYMMKKPDDFK